MSETIFGHFCPFEGNEGNVFLVSSECTDYNSIDDSVFLLPNCKGPLNEIDLQMLQAQPICYLFWQTVHEENDSIVIKYHCEDGVDEPADFYLKKVSADGLLGIVRPEGFPTYVPFIPTNETLEHSLVSAIYKHSRNGNLSHFLDYHFDNSSATPKQFFDYLSDFTKRFIGSWRAYNVKPARDILEWLRSRSVNVVELDKWFENGSYTALSTFTLQLPQHSEPEVKGEGLNVKILLAYQSGILNGTFHTLPVQRQYEILALLFSRHEASVKNAITALYDDANSDKNPKNLPQVVERTNSLIIEKKLGIALVEGRKNRQSS